MEATKEDLSESEDVPSDFFDDFNKDEFMEGLQVIDSWDDEDKKRRPPRIDLEALDSVKDLRELIDGREEERGHPSRDRHRDDWERASEERLDGYIKPGSRRDPNKTKEAIKRDKEVKVKEYLAKSLDATDELKPPGTELDDFFEESKTKTAPVEEAPPQKKKRSRTKERHHSPARHQRRSPRRSPVRRSPARRSPARRSPARRSPTRRSPARRSPARRSPGRRSPRRSPRHSPRWSPRRLSPSRGKFQLYKPRWHPSMNRHISPHRSPRRRYSRSPPPRRYAHRSRSPSPSRIRDSFLYPRESNLHLFDIPEPQFAQVHPGAMPGYPYPQMAQEYPVGYTGPPFDFLVPSQPPAPGAQPGIPGMPFAPSAPVPQPVPAPMMNQGPIMNQAPMMNPVPPPAMVPAPSQVPPPQKLTPVPNPVKDVTRPYDALAQLVAEGKITQEDYLKLAPTKVTSMDTNKRVLVLNRCNTALGKLSALLLPNRLMMNNNMVGAEPKSLAPRYCSPLKRQGAVDFHFTKMTGRATAQQNKQLVDSIIGTLGLEKVVARPKTKVAKNMKDAACQTSKPYCDVCEVREAVRLSDSSTSIDAEHFCSTVHTQVVEQDLISSKAVFAPSGSIADGAPISIAHMTPAQLVSQLAARAKTLKQPPADPMPNQYMRRNPNSYDQHQQYQNNYNYRY